MCTEGSGSVGLEEHEDFAMKTFAFLVMTGLLGIGLLMGDSVTTLGIEKLSISQAPARQAKSLDPEAYSLQPIASLIEAKKEISRDKLDIPMGGRERSLRLAHLARLYFFLGEAGEQETRKYNYEQGRIYARLLIKEQPLGVEGFYWLALNLCGTAGVSGPKDGLALLPRIIELMKTALHIDEVYDQAGAHRVLGRIYFKAPGWPLSVGDVDKSISHLSSAVKLAPENSTNHLFLAETLYSVGKRTKAKEELEKVMIVTHHALGPQGLEEDQQRAQELIKKYKMKREVAFLF
jgi:tetratricopeptide (TPR) repeat protein